MTNNNVVDASSQFGAAKASASLAGLVANYQDMGTSLAFLASAKPTANIDTSLQTHQQKILLHKQQSVIKQIASHEINTRGDMIALLEVWRSESLDNEDAPKLYEKLVLSVLQALKKSIRH